MPSCITPRSAAIQVLRELEEATNAHDERVKVLFKDHDWVIGKASNDILPSKILDADAIWKLSRDHHRLKYAIFLLDALKASAIKQEQLVRERLEGIASKLSKGLTSLPDEILGQIFRYSTQHPHKGTRYAVWLSQVSRRFRAIVLGDRSLWTILNLWNDTTKEELGRIISRSGDDSDLHPVLNMNREVNVYDVRRFIREFSPSIPRWRTLTITGEWDTHNSRISMDEMLDDFMEDFKLDLPRLDELCISECCFDADYNRVVRRPYQSLREYEAPPWTTPSLRALRCTDYIPYTPFPLTSISVFSISLTLIRDEVPWQIGRLFTFLATIQSVTEIDLGLENYDCAAELNGTLQIGTPLVLQLVTSFRLHIIDFQLPEDIDWVVVPILKAFRMPNLKHFSLCFQIHDEAPVYLVYPTETSLRHLFRVLLPDLFTHSPITSFTFEMDTRECIIGEAEYAEVVVPLDWMPHLFTLTLKGCGRTRVSFSLPENCVPDAASSCSLRILELRSSNSVMDFKKLEVLIESLKNVNAWDTLDHVVVRDCKSLDYDAALKAIGEERLQFIR